MQHCDFLMQYVTRLLSLAQMSGLGRPYPVTNPRLEGLRKWSVKGFEKHLMFYLSFDDYIEIV
jgi:toxin ParE1/3/4